MSYLATATADAALEAILVPDTEYWLSIHSAPPTGGAHEASGGAYTRQSIKFGPASAAAQYSTDAQTVTTPTETSKWPYVGVWTEQTGGSFKWGDKRTDETATTTVGAGQILSFAIGAVAAEKVT